MDAGSIRIIHFITISYVVGSRVLLSCHFVVILIGCLLFFVLFFFIIKVAPMTSARFGHCATAAIGGFVVVAGGGEMFKHSIHCVERYDVTNNVWSQLAPLKWPRSFFHLCRGQFWTYKFTTFMRRISFYYYYYYYICRSCISFIVVEIIMDTFEIYCWENYIYIYSDRKRMQAINSHYMSHEIECFIFNFSTQYWIPWILISIKLF